MDHIRILQQDSGIRSNASIAVLRVAAVRLSFEREAFGISVTQRWM